MLQRRSIFQIPTWQFSKSCRAVKSVNAAGTLVAGSFIGEGKMLRKALKKLLGLRQKLIICVDFIDVLTLSPHAMSLQTASLMQNLLR